MQRQRHEPEYRGARRDDHRPEPCDTGLEERGPQRHAGAVRLLDVALEPRLKAGVLLMGGLFSTTSAPEVDSFNFAPRVRTPILMLNGDQDHIFPLQTSQRPLFQALGTPSADKKHVLYPGGHEDLCDPAQPDRPGSR